MKGSVPWLSLRLHTPSLERACSSSPKETQVLIVNRQLHRHGSGAGMNVRSPMSLPELRFALLALTFSWAGTSAPGVSCAIHAPGKEAEKGDTARAIREIRDLHRPPLKF